MECVKRVSRRDSLGFTSGGKKALCLNLWSVRCVWTRLAGWNSSGFYINALHLGKENAKVSA